MRRIEPEKVVAVGLLLFVAVLAAVAEESADQIVTLRWALGAAQTASDSPSAIQRDTQLETGTRLKFLVEPLSPGSVYLIMLDSDDAINVLYRRPATPAATGEPTYIPPGRQWFEVDQGAGLETFFLLASVEPLAELESLLSQHESATADAQAEIVPQIVAEIRRLHKAHRNFSRPVEKPVMIGGQTRGGPAGGLAAIDRLAVEISAERFYGKTITIEH